MASPAAASAPKTAGAGCVVSARPGMDGFQDGILGLIDRGASVLDGELGVGLGVGDLSVRSLVVVLGPPISIRPISIRPISIRSLNKLVLFHHATGVPEAAPRDGVFVRWRICAMAYLCDGVFVRWRICPNQFAW